MGCVESTPLAELQSGGLTKEQSIDGELTAGPVAVTCVRGFSALGGTNTVTGVGMGMGGAGGGISGSGGSRCPPMCEIKDREGNLKYIGARKDSEHPLPQAMEFSDAAGKKVALMRRNTKATNDGAHIFTFAPKDSAQEASGTHEGVPILGSSGTHEGVPIYQVASVDRTGIGFAFNFSLVDPGGAKTPLLHADILKKGRSTQGYNYLIEITSNGSVVARGMGGLATWNSGPGTKNPATYTLECADGNDLLALLGLCFFADYIMFAEA